MDKIARSEPSDNKTDVLDIVARLYQHCPSAPSVAPQSAVAPQHTNCEVKGVSHGAQGPAGGTSDEALAGPTYFAGNVLASVPAHSSRNSRVDRAVPESLTGPLSPAAYEAQR